LSRGQSPVIVNFAAFESLLWSKLVSLQSSAFLIANLTSNPAPPPPPPPPRPRPRPLRKSPRFVGSKASTSHQRMRRAQDEDQQHPAITFHSFRRALRALRCVPGAPHRSRLSSNMLCSTVSGSCWISAERLRGAKGPALRGSSVDALKDPANPSPASSSKCSSSSYAWSSSAPPSTSRVLPAAGSAGSGPSPRTLNCVVARLVCGSQPSRPPPRLVLAGVSALHDGPPPWRAATSAGCPAISAVSTNFPEQRHSYDPRY